MSCTRLEHLGATRAQLPSFQSALGGILASVLPLEAACAGLARRLDRRDVDPRSLVPAALALEHQAAEIGVRAVETAAELVGVRSYGSGGAIAVRRFDVACDREHWL